MYYLYIINKLTIQLIVQDYMNTKKYLRILTFLEPYL